MAADFATPEAVPVLRLPAWACRLEDLECREASVQHFALIGIECANVRSIHFDLVHLTLNCAKAAAVCRHTPDREKLLRDVPNAITIAELRQVVEIESQAI